MNAKLDKTTGAYNLLINCAQLKPHETLLIICENPTLGWYDTKAPKAVAEMSMQIGVKPTILTVGAPENFAVPEIVEAIGVHDCTIYFSRIGDQDRFGDPLPGTRSVMCYIRDIDMLCSPYGSASYGGFVDVKEAVNEILFKANQIDITCPLGTQLCGSTSYDRENESSDVSVRRFPLGVPVPVSAAKFSGKVALTHFLTPTGSKSYSPDNIVLNETSFAEVNNGRIVKFYGNQTQVNNINQHYDMVADQFGIERDIVHSWHAGIHPGSQYFQMAADNPDRWSNSVFTNPRFLHFHTCGDYAPAEICWMVLDHTICVDGVNLWEDGRLICENFAQTRAAIEKWPELVNLFAHPARQIGLSGER